MIPWPQGRDGQQTPKVRSRLIRQKAENEKKILEKLDMQRPTKSFSFQIQEGNDFCISSPMSNQ
jgi:hypothetical protein